MSWDFYITGIKHQTLKTNLEPVLSRFRVPGKECRDFEQRFETIVQAEDLTALESRLYELCKDEDQYEQSLFELGIVHIADFSSKAICFAMNQLVYYYNTGFTGNSEQLRFTKGAYKTMLSFTEIIGLLDWLIIISGLLYKVKAPSWETKFSNRKHDEALRLEAQRFINERGCEGRDFEFFGDQVYMFMDWQKKIQKTGAGYYQWTNAY